MPELPVSWSVGKFSTLGITFDIDEMEMANYNAHSKFDKMKRSIQSWIPRNLTLIGRICIVKTLGLSQFTYVVTNLHTPLLLCKQIQTTINKFIWNQSIPKVKLEVIRQQIEDGGLKYPDFENQVKSLKLSFIKRLFNAKESNWKTTFQQFIIDIDIKDRSTSRCSIDRSLIRKLPKFYDDLITFWAELKSKVNTFPKSRCEILQEYIWWNPHITINGKTVFYKAWYIKGIKTIADITNSYGHLLLDDELKSKFNIQFIFLDYMGIRQAIPRE